MHKSKLSSWVYGVKGASETEITVRIKAPTKDIRVSRRLNGKIWRAVAKTKDIGTTFQSRGM